ncbi:MAG: PEGA domain-containing protein, partial [Myxococcales bacterium]|nr:PEGA domain-containing protein [Myxococcales bacterium]
DAAAPPPNDAPSPDDAASAPDDTPDAAGGRDTGFVGKRILTLEIDDCPVPPAVSHDQLIQIAGEHYARAEVLYNERGDYDGAIREFVTSYCLVPIYSVLKDIGQTYERLLEFEHAVAYLERYVLEVPDDVPGAAEKRRSVSARAQVLRGLAARLQVATSPPGATVWLTDALGVRRNAGRSDAGSFEVTAGSYTMTVEMAGYEPLERQIDVAIGKPYSFYFPLAPRHGHLRVTTVPGDARIFVDQKLVGIGRYDDDLPRGDYQLTIEAPGRLPETRSLEIVADREVDLAIKLPPRPASGRTQLLVASGIAGGILGSVAFGGLDQNTTARGGLGFVGGLGVGLVGGYYGIPEDIEVGTSSYIITTGLIGAGEAGLVTSLFFEEGSTNTENTIGPLSVGGLAVGATFGALTASRWRYDAGDAALLNSGALWGTVGGFLFSVVFESKHRVSQALVLGGLNLGVVSGALIGRSAEVSRGHVALIDLAGLAGMGISVSVQAAIDDAINSDSSSERTAHFALAGMTGGLILGAYFTRNMDVPKLGRFAPVIGKPAEGRGMVFGLAGEL